MTNKHGDKIFENMIVRLRESEVIRRKRIPAQVVGWIGPQCPGGVEVAPSLEGLRFWNIDALEPVPGKNG